MTLRDAIRSGEYSAGERLREEQIASKYSVSRTPVRNALARLQNSGLLVSLPTGLAVASLPLDAAFELFGLREMLEGTAARFAALYATEYEILHLKTLTERFREALGDRDQLLELNRAFHETIYGAARNRFLRHSLEELHDVLAISPTPLYLASQRPERSVVEHEEVLAAIIARNADAADAAMRGHIRSAHNDRQALLAGQTGRSAAAGNR